ncbi:hypothetical protein [Streptomonospora salina]|uniref:Uncharacterized membrane protein YidH (DUF202 family) n=1 Tax=Streptomonospora salina TaxID=104205 RepID=A0A841EAC5_9ACTN|nr:hypothetical protein [Streptomonospora salina]MBB5999956.1 uncharacterized membrane protein YidH (DUF202 family) [Streptomonospora salina]
MGDAMATIILLIGLALLLAGFVYGLTFNAFDKNKRSKTSVAVCAAMLFAALGLSVVAALMMYLPSFLG